MRDENTKGLTTGLMQGKRGIVMGVANDHSIAWSIAKKIISQGAEVAFTYQDEAFAKRLKPLCESLGVPAIMFPCDVEDEQSVAKVFSDVKEKWGTIDFLVHSIGYSDKNELKGKYHNTTRKNFIKTMVISCFSFTEVTRIACDMMPNGGSILTLTYDGSVRVMPNYNVMGVAKAGLESSVRYLANDYGRDNIRINAISAGPMRTLAGAGIADARAMFNFHKEHAPLGRTITNEDIGGSGLYLLSDLSSGVTGEIHYVDSGYNIISTPTPS